MKATLRYRFLFVAAIAGLVAAYAGVTLGDHRSRRETPTVRVLAGEIPPMVRGDGTGVEVAHLRRLLDLDAGVELEVTVFPFSRHWRNFAAVDGYDLIMTVPEGFDLGGWNSGPYVNYQNGLVYRRDAYPDGLGADPLARLQGRRVVGFAGAARLIEAVETARPDFALYLERYSQHRQSVMLASGLADAVIAERSIVEFYLREAGADLDAFVFEPVFCPTRYVLAVRDGALRDRLSGGVEPVDTETLVDRPEAGTGGGLAVREPGIEECLQ